MLAHWRREADEQRFDYGLVPQIELPAHLDPPTLPECKETVNVEAGKTADGLFDALRMLYVTLRFNLRSHKSEWQFWDDVGYGRVGRLMAWRDLDDRSSAFLRDAIINRFYIKGKDDKIPLKFGRYAWQDCVNVLLYRNEVDPFTEWLEAIPPWDGIHRIDRWMTDCFQIVADDVDLAHWASRFILLGAVWRAYSPGTKLDEMPVLIGQGGIGKSTSLRRLLPPEWSEWFCDGLNLAGDSKARTEALQGRVIVECSEMTGAVRGDVESLKAFLSAQDDGSVRLAYRRNPETMLRRAVLVGTADRSDPLPNDDNLRRFVPVRLVDGNPIHITEYLSKNRCQLWAEAVHLYHEGESARLPDALVAAQRASTDRARSKDSAMEDAVAGFIQGGREGFTLAEVAVATNLVTSTKDIAKLQMREQRRLGSALRVFGYTSKQTGRGAARVNRWWKE